MLNMRVLFYCFLALITGKRFLFLFERGAKFLLGRLSW